LSKATVCGDIVRTSKLRLQMFNGFRDNFPANATNQAQTQYFYLTGHQESHENELLITTNLFYRS